MNVKTIFDLKPRKSYDNKSELTHTAHTVQGSQIKTIIHFPCHTVKKLINTFEDFVKYQRNSKFLISSEHLIAVIHLNLSLTTV